MISKFHCLDLSEILNHRACSVQQAEEDAYLTLSKSALPEELILFNQAFEYDGVPFIMLKQNKWDNIEMVGQRVYFPEMKVTAIHIIGTALDTDMSDTVHFELDSTPVYASDLQLRYFAADPNLDHMNNSCVFQTPYVYSDGKPNAIVQPCLWYTRITIKESQVMNAMLLADNPCMHLFSITIEQHIG